VLYLLWIDSGQAIELEQFRNKAADVAFAVGDIIRKHEDKNGMKRNEKISAGLPGGTEPFKSKARYKNHFLSYMRKDGRLDGAMSFLKLINMIRDDRGKVWIGLTNAGVDFACLENPPMDLSDLNHSLAEAEVEFYLQHVQDNVPGEFKAIQWLLTTISEGVKTREEINRQLTEKMGPIWKTSDAVINTQRAGLSSRASELGLIDTDKSGTGAGVIYKSTDRGKTFLEKTTTAWEKPSYSNADSGG
jgi:hypothetical protein